SWANPRIVLSGSLSSWATPGGKLADCGQPVRPGQLVLELGPRGLCLFLLDHLRDLTCYIVDQALFLVEKWLPLREGPLAEDSEPLTAPRIFPLTLTAATCLCAPSAKKGGLIGMPVYHDPCAGMGRILPCRREQDRDVRHFLLERHAGIRGRLCHAITDR
ncbi:MAG: hypothetical protein ACOX3E_05395, partial [Desulfomonilia bacterium]